VLDHIAFSHPDLPSLVARVRRAGVKVLEDVHDFGNTTLKAVMIEGPDRIAIELIGNQARKGRAVEDSV